MVRNWAGWRFRLIYRLHRYQRRKGERASFTLAEYKRLLRAAHHQLPVALAVRR
ncbi:hypothetical protein GCM10010191_12880 [Actinomadura vinacea]|uniref:Transposase n=2 Tax=Actinomadura vinacea TaxID=115336 RepID=A0ABN3IJG6_9ACTN